MSLLHIDMTQLVEILAHVRQESTYSTLSIIAADDLVTQGTGASATMILTYLNQDNPVPAR